MIKGRYVAQIVMDIDVDEKHVHCVPLEEIRRRMANGAYETAIKSSLMGDVFGEEIGKLDVIQMYADVYEVSDDENT